MNFLQNGYLAIAISAPSYSLPSALADGKKASKFCIYTRWQWKPRNPSATRGGVGMYSGADVDSSNAFAVLKINDETNSWMLDVPMI